MTEPIVAMTESEADKLSDAELVRLSLEEKNNFLYLIRRYEAKLKRYIMRLTVLGENEEEDILQNVFIKVYVNLNDFDKQLKFSSWIYRITHNEVISHHRRSLARPQTGDFNEEIIDRLVSDFSPEKDIDKKLLKQNIFELMDKLKPLLRDVLILRYFEEKSYEEISDILKKPGGTVATLLAKAKKEFLLLWSKEYTYGSQQ